MKLHKQEKSYIFFALIVLSFGMIAWPFLNLIIFSIITAFLSKWFYRYLLKKTKPVIAISLTWIAIFVTILCPLYFISYVSFSQVQDVVEEVQTIVQNNKDDQLTLFNNKEGTTSDNALNMISGKIENFKADHEKEFKILEDAIIDGAKKVWEFSVTKVGSILKEIPIFIVKVILYIFLTTSLLINGKKVKKTIKAIIPLDNRVIDLYISRLQEMTIGIAKWSIIVALIQAVLTTASFMLVGIPYAWIVFMISFVLYIPMVGTVLLYIPAIIWLVLTGSYVSAILIFFWNSIIVANVDNVLRWRFVTDDAKVDNSLIFLSMLSGLTLFGIMWVLYWPLVVIIGVTSIKIYMEIQEKLKKEKKLKIYCICK